MVLITGASGFLGGELLHRLLAEKRGVRGLDLRPPANTALKHLVQVGDLLDGDACARACDGIEILVHCAARQHQDAPRWGRTAYFAANPRMTAGLVSSAIAAGVKHIVFVSSDMVYGLPPGRALCESDPPCPIGPYGRSKRESELHCEAAREHGVTVTILRPRLIVGPGRLGVLTRLFDAVHAGRRIPMIGDGSTRYQMVSVADVADACVKAIIARTEGTYNIGSASPPPVRELLNELCRRAGTTALPVAYPAWAVTSALRCLDSVRLSPLVPEQFRIAPLDYVLDISAAKRALGWSPRLSDVDMLWRAYQAYTGLVISEKAAATEAVSPSIDRTTMSDGARRG